MARYGVIIEVPVNYQKYLCIATEIGFVDVVDGWENVVKIVETYKEKLCNAKIWMIVDDNGLIVSNNLQEFCEEVEYEHPFCEEIEEEEGEE